ncbi:MAG: DUF63 family protein [archaeon]|jgi:uncharacterized membrane protein
METNFIQEFFINPIISPELQGYNLVNTGVYIILLILCCAAIYLFLNKKIKFNTKFFISIIPYILFGISMRVIMHQIEAGHLVIEGITKTASPLQIGFWFFTPGIWILTFTIVLIGLIISKVWKELNYKRLFLFGATVALIPILFNFAHFNNWIPFIITTIIIIVISYGLCRVINRFTKYKILHDKLNYLIVAGQAIDGIASSIAIAFFGFSEQHVFSNMLIQINPIIFAGLKLVLAVLICWSLDDYIKDFEKQNKNPQKIVQRKNLIGFIKVIIAILGFATGLASLFKLGII